MTKTSSPGVKASTAQNEQIDASLTFRRKSTYALGDVADGCQGVVVNTFLLFYLTTTCAMTGSLAGLALAITQMIEAGTTPLFGYLSDRTRSRWERRHPFMFAASVPLAQSEQTNGIFILRVIGMAAAVPFYAPLLKHVRNATS